MCPVTAEQSVQHQRILPLPSTTLAVCSRNRPKLLQETIESVLQGEELPTEIVIVDQSDRPNPALPTLELPTGCSLRYIWTDRIGISAARNRAITEARYDAVVLIDDDMAVAPTWFGALVRALVEGGPNSSVTGRVLPAGTDQKDVFVPSTIEDERPAVYSGAIDRDVLFTNNMAIWRSLAGKVGLFDERLGPGTPFPAAEDNDFAFRLLRAGFRIIYVPSAVLYHRAWRPRSQYNRVLWGYGYGQGAFYARHARKHPRMLRRLAWDAIYYVLPFPIRWRRKGSQALGDVAYGCALVGGAVHWTLKHGLARQ